MIMNLTNVKIFQIDLMMLNNYYFKALHNSVNGFNYPQTTIKVEMIVTIVTDNMNAMCNG